jgi:hypothetical protein
MSSSEGIRLIPHQDDGYRQPFCSNREAPQAISSVLCPAPPSDWMAEIIHFLGLHGRPRYYERMSYPKMKSPYRPDSDRRRLFRHNTIVPIDYYPEGSRVSPTPKPTKVNLSGGGIRFATQRMFRVGDRLEVVLALPTLAPLHVTAEIIHVRPDDLDDSTQVVRCRFVSMTQRSRERVIQFLLRSQAFQLQEANSG